MATFMRRARLHAMPVPGALPPVPLRRDDLGILAQIFRPSVGGVAPDCYFTGLGLILSQNAHW